MQYLKTICLAVGFLSLCATTLTAQDPYPTINPLATFTKSDGTINGQWSRKPATMIRKVALTQALREAFPEDLGGMYASEEMGVDFAEEPLPPVQIDEQPTLAEVPEAAPEEAPPAAQTTMDDLEGMF